MASPTNGKKSPRRYTVSSDRGVVTAVRILYPASHELPKDYIVPVAAVRHRAFPHAYMRTLPSIISRDIDQYASTGAWLRATEYIKIVSDHRHRLDAPKTNNRVEIDDVLLPILPPDPEDHHDPEKMAEYLANRRENPWLDRFSESLDRRRKVESLSRIMSVWGLSQDDVARSFGVTLYVVDKWLRISVPSEHAEAVAELAAATDLLIHYLKRDRIPAVVRRPVQSLDGASLTSLLEQGDTRALLAACQDLFRFDQVHA